MKRLIPVRPETLASLEKLAAEVSGLVEHRVEPLQVAALMIERYLESPRAEARYWREEGLSTQQVRQRLVGRRAAGRKRQS